MIPRVIHLNWLDEKPASMVLATVEYWKVNGEGRDVVLHGDSDLLIESWRENYLLYAHNHQNKSDWMRWSSMLDEGGWYFDIDIRTARGTSLDAIESGLAEDTCLVVPMVAGIRKLEADILCCPTRWRGAAAVHDYMLEKHKQQPSYVHYTLGMVNQLYRAHPDWFTVGSANTLRNDWRIPPNPVPRTCANRITADRDTEPEIGLLACSNCVERPEGCWKAIVYGCKNDDAYARRDELRRSGKCPLTDPSLVRESTVARSANDDAIARLAVCKTCDHHRVDKALNWCDLYDNNHSSHFNCARSCAGRCSARLFKPETRCEKWLAIPPPVPVVIRSTVLGDCDCPVCGFDAGPIETVHDIHRVVRGIIESSMQPPKFKLPQCLVTAGEGKFETGIVVAVKLLRDKVKCDISMKIFHNGPWKTDLSKYDVELIDVRASQKHHPARNCGGWAAKTYAVTHADAERVMFLDADAYLVRDPQPLFDLLQDHRYVLWADYGPGGACDVIPNSLLHHQNGGEYLVNMQTYWREMMATRFLDNWSHIFWSQRLSGESYRSIGDECSTRLVRSIIQDRGVLRADWVKRTRGVGILCKYDGVDYVAHRMRRESKLFPGSFPRSNSYWPYEEDVLEYFSELSPGYQIPNRTTGDPKRDAVVANRFTRLATAGRGPNVQLKATVARRLARINAARR